LLVLAGASEAFAARPDTRRMSCQQGRALIAQYGSVVMTTGQHTFARIVSGRGFCAPGEETVRKIVPSADSPRCDIGFTCRDRLIFSR